MKSSPEACALLTGAAADRPRTRRSSATSRACASSAARRPTPTRTAGAPTRAPRSTARSRPTARAASSSPSARRARGPTGCAGSTVPTLVIHGSADTLIDPIGGRRTAELIPGARFELIEGMGHDYPPRLWAALGRPRRGHIESARSRRVTTADADFLGIRIPEGGGPAMLPVTRRSARRSGSSTAAAGSPPAPSPPRRPPAGRSMWITTQYVANAKPGDVVELAVDVVVARPGDEPDPRPRHRRRAHGAARHDGPHRPARRATSTGGARCRRCRRPRRASRSSCRGSTSRRDSFVDRMERYLVPEHARAGRRGAGRDVGAGARAGRSARRRRRAFVADIIPMALGMALGQGPGGTSLDNTVRIVLADPTDDWILLDIEAEGMQPLDRLRPRPPVAPRRHADRRRHAERDRPHEPPPDRTSRRRPA